MRLGQLARKLSITSSAITDFLAAQQIAVEAGSNTRLPFEQVLQIVEHFAPDQLESIRESLFTEPDEVVAEPQHEELVIEATAEQPQPVDELHQEEPSMLEPGIVEPEGDINPVSADSAMAGEPDVIRAPKVELPGLKVLGKIDLPEPKKKTETAEGSDPKARPGRHDKQSRRESDRPRRNTVVAQREREAREAERKRREQAEREKEARTRKYESKVMKHRQEKPGKPAKASQVHASPAKPAGPAPQGVWAKFINWLFRG